MTENRKEKSSYNNNIILKAENISKIFKGPENVHLLKGINLEIEEGSSISIVGASGVGKTTLLHILATLDSSSSGKVFLDGKILKNRKKSLYKIRNSDFGFIFQSFNLFDDLTVLENILLPIRIARKNPNDFLQNAYQLLNETGLISRKNFLAKLLSGGEKQRLAIARSMINNPKIIFADEPTGDLDSINSKKVHNMLLNCVKKNKVSLVIVTHDLELANMCDKKYQLKDGKLYHQ
jgi:lipoprotein-releasing system ATP-binding protein